MNPAAAQRATSTFGTRHRRAREPSGKPVLLEVLQMGAEPHDKIAALGTERETHRPGARTSGDDVARVEADSAQLVDHVVGAQLHGSTAGTAPKAAELRS